MKKILLSLVALLWGAMSLQAQMMPTVPTVCADGNSDCYLIVERTENVSDAWSSFMLEVRQEDYDFALAIYFSGGTDTLRLCTGLGKVTMTLWNLMGNNDNIGLTVTDSLGNVLIDQFGGFTAASFGSEEVVNAAACVNTGCLPPTGVTIGNITSTSAEVSVADAESTIEYTCTADGEEAGDWVTASGNPFSITGLIPGLTYTVVVRNVCGESNYSSPVEGTFSTECDKLSLPLTIDFEDPFLKNGTVPKCWYITDNNPYIYGMFPDKYSGLKHGGASCGYWFQSGDVYFPALVTPPLDTDLKDLVVSFYYICTNSNDGGIVEVGAAVDPEDPGTYIPIDTMHYGLTSYEWTVGALDLSSYAGSAQNLYFRVKNRVSSGTNVMIDDIVISQRSECVPLSGKMKVIAVAPGSITVEVKNDRLGHPAYNVYCGTGEVLDKGSAYKGSATGGLITVSGLTSGTTYHVWVEGDCGDSQSEPVSLGWHTTACDAVAVTADNPYTTDLETLADTVCMRHIDYVNMSWRHSVSLSGLGLVNNVPHSGTGNYYLCNNPGASMLILPTFDFSALDTIAALTFARFQYYDVLYSPAHLSVWYRNADDAGWTKVEDILPTTGEYVEHYVKLPGSQGASFYQVAIMGENYESHNTASIDDISVGAAPHCAPPEFTVADINNRTVTLNWNECGMDEVLVDVRRDNGWNWNAFTAEGENGSGSVKVEPLQMNNTYVVRMAAVCEDGTQSIFSQPVTVTLPLCDDYTTHLSWLPTDKDTTIRDGLFAVDYYGPDAATIYDYIGAYSYSEVLIDKASLEGMDDIGAIVFTADSANQGMSLESVQVYMGTTTDSELTDFHYDETFQLVYDGPATFNEAGDVVLGLVNPFVWDGSSNIVVGFYNANIVYDYDALYFGAHTTDVNRFVYIRSINEFPAGGSAYVLPNEKFLENAATPDIKLLSCTPTCYTPVVRLLTSTTSSITVAWYKEKNMDVELSIRAAGTSTWTNSVIVKYSTGKTKYTFDMLMDNTEYEIRVRQDCSAIGLGNSDDTIVSMSTEIACSTPQDITIVDYSAHTATIGWVGTPYAERWSVHVWNDEFDRYYSVNSNPAVVDELAPGSSYKVQVRAFCSSIGQKSSAWSETVTFQNVCSPVTGLTATPAGSDVKLSWQQSEGNTSYLVEWGKAGTDLNTQIGYAEVEETSYTVSGLKSDTYTFRVLAECGQGWYSQAVEANATVVGIDEVDGVDARFSLRPNPASDRVVLSLDDAESTADVSILSVDGRTVIHLVVSGGVAEVNLADLSSGTYFVRVHTEGWLGVRKLVVR